MSGRFEDTLGALEGIVRRLEAGDLPLEDAIRLYEEGVALAREGHEQLEATERRIALLARGPTGIEERPLDTLPSQE